MAKYSCVLCWKKLGESLVTRVEHMFRLSLSRDVRKVKRSKKREEGTTKKFPNVKWRGEAHAQHVLTLSGDPGGKKTQVFPNTKKEGKCPEKSFHTCSKFVRNLFGKFGREKERKGEEKKF